MFNHNSPLLFENETRFMELSGEIKVHLNDTKLDQELYKLLLDYYDPEECINLSAALWNTLKNI